MTGNTDTADQTLILQSDFKCELDTLIKPELRDYENLFNSIDFSHDLNDVISFNDIEVSANFSPLKINVDSFQEINDIEMQSEDPLYISDFEKNNINTIFNDSTSECSRKSARLQNKLLNNVSKKDKCESEVGLSQLDNLSSTSDQDEEAEGEEEELPLHIIKKLTNLHIKIIHEIPPQHKIEYTACQTPSRKVKTLFERYGPLRKGSYSSKEDEIIINNWKTFCKFHDWNSKNVKPFCNWKQNNRCYIYNVKERQKFYQFLANGLPWRTLHSVYQRFKTLHDDKTTKIRYTSKEDKEILTYIQNERLDKRKTKYKELSKILNRTNRSIAKRYQYLKRIQNNSGEEREVVNVKWTLPLIKKFIQTLMNLTLTDNIKELKNAILPNPVWQKMEKKLNIDKRALKEFWYYQLHLQLFCTYPIYLNDIKIQLIEYMHQKGITHSREIIWSNVAQCFDGITSVFLCRTFHHLLRDYKMSDSSNLEDTMEYLYNSVIPEIKNHSMDKFLPKIIYKDEKIYLDKQNDDSIVMTNTVDDKNE